MYESKRNIRNITIDILLFCAALTFNTIALKFFGRFDVQKEMYGLILYFTTIIFALLLITYSSDITIKERNIKQK